MTTSQGQCKRCNEPVHYSGLCQKHFRFSRMRHSSNYVGKKVPSESHLESLWVQSQGRCPQCSRQLNWLRKDGGSTCISIQHDRSGEIRLLCLRCNSQHAANDGDSFYQIGSDNKKCRGCNHIKPRTEFYVRRDDNREMHKCKKCTIAKNTAWRLNKRRKQASPTQPTTSMSFGGC